MTARFSPSGATLLLPVMIKGRMEGGRQKAEEVEACFQQTLVVARCQQARALDLRAALSLSRLWLQRGQWAAARELLMPIYDWFTEGFAMPDLREAKALLEMRGVGPRRVRHVYGVADRRLATAIRINLHVCAWRSPFILQK